MPVAGRATIAEEPLAGAKLTERPVGPNSCARASSCGVANVATAPNVIASAALPANESAQGSLLKMRLSSA